MPKPRTPLLTADCIAFDGHGRVLLIRRKFAPFAGKYALPGGFVEIGESVEEACRRELLEETGVRAGALELVGVYSDPGRDPRAHTVSVAFLTRLRGGKPVPGDDAQAAEWVADRSPVDLAFDHALILRDARRALKRARTGR